MPATTPIEFWIEFPEGNAGVQLDAGSAIARPYRRLLEEGAEPGKITVLGVESVEGSRLVLGTLCETVAGRLLFFPGFTSRRLERHFTRGLAPRPVNVIVDHLTFELATQRGHFTEVRDNGRRRAVPGIPEPRAEVAPGLRRWFGITARSWNRLELLPRAALIAAEVPISDAERRRSLLDQSKDAIMLPVEWPTPGFFAQVNFFVDFDPTRELTHMTTFIPAGPPELVESVRAKTTQRIATNYVYGLSLFNGSHTLRMDCHLAPGVPVSELAICV